MNNPVKQKIRVCFVMPKAYPIFNPAIESVFGGAEVDLYQIATELAKDPDFEVSFIVADYGQADEEERENVRILKSLNFSQNPLTGAVKIWKALKLANADFYMLKTASPGVPLVQVFCNKNRRCLVYKNANQGECDGSYLKRHPVLGKFFIQSLRKASRVITQNQQDHDNLKRHFQIDSAVIPNGHRVREVNSIDKKTILWVGRSARVKGPARFLELVKAFQDEPFVMICQRATGDLEYDALKAAAMKIENLEFIERVPFKDIDSYFEQAKVFVNTSDSEGYPNTFIQACKASTAILSYAVNPDSFLDAHYCGICCNGDFDRLVEHLREMLDESQYRGFGENGLTYVKNRHDISALIEHYKVVFREIVTSKS